MYEPKYPAEGTAVTLRFASKMYNVYIALEPVSLGWTFGGFGWIREEGLSCVRVVCACVPLNIRLRV
jgi:hypothetical protein